MCSHWCPHCRGFTVQDCLLYCGPNGVLVVEVSLYRTAYCGPNGVLIVKVLLYRTAYCALNGVLIVEVSCMVYLIYDSEIYVHLCVIL